jgi:xylulose-5-phosphate/fructose-6-phosphate phosphoketolase
MQDARLRAREYTREHGEDHPDVAGWAWDPSSASGANAAFTDTGDDSR